MDSPELEGTQVRVEGKPLFKSRKLQFQLEALERQVKEQGMTLTDWLAEQVADGKSMTTLEPQVGIPRKKLGVVYDRLGVKRLSREELLKRTSERVWSDPEVAARMREGARKSMLGRRNTPEMQEAINKGRELHLADPLERERMAEKARENMNRRLAEDPEYLRHLAEGRSRYQKRFREDPELQASRKKNSSIALKKSWSEDPNREVRAAKSQANLEHAVTEEIIEANKVKISAALKKRWREDPEYRARQMESRALKNQDPEFVARRKAAAREGIMRKWEEDIEYRTKMSDFQREAMTQRWSESSWREKMKEVLRKRNTSPEAMLTRPSSAIVGNRGDVGFSKSMWEANIARMLIFVGREYQRHQIMTLKVEDDEKDIFDGLNETQFELDFLMTDPRGNKVAYEIMAHPNENPMGWLKLEMAMEQYPEIEFRPINPKLFFRLEKRFKKRINADPQFKGWEDRYDNLKNNPEKFS